jgi:hypothetical protein
MRQGFETVMAEPEKSAKGSERPDDAPAWASHDPELMKALADFDELPRQVLEDFEPPWLELALSTSDQAVDEGPFDHWRPMPDPPPEPDPRYHEETDPQPLGADELVMTATLSEEVRSLRAG